MPQINEQSRPNQERLDVICFGGEDWWYHNRGHIDMQLMRRFASRGTTLYINSIVMQKPRLGKGSNFGMRLKRKLKSIFRGLCRTEAGFWVYSPVSIPMHHIGCLRKLNAWLLKLQLWLVRQRLGLKRPLVWVACPAACDAALRLPKSHLIYQRTDRYELYPNVDSEIIREYDLKLKQAAELTVYVNRRLLAEEGQECRRAFYLDHGVDYHLFAAPSKNGVPEELRGIPRPIVGFFGGIDNHTSDIPFLLEVIDLLSEMSFVLVGNASVDCTRLHRRANVRLLGQRPYEQIPAYGRQFDVTIMPWRQNEWIKACNPIKLKEYLALGKPIVSTPFDELAYYKEVVYVGPTPQEFADRIRQALAEDNPQRRQQRQARVAEQTWDAKAVFILREIENLNTKACPERAEALRSLSS